MLLYLHLKYPNLSDKGYYPYKYEVPFEQIDRFENQLTLQEFLFEAAKVRTDLNPAYIQISPTENAKPLTNLNMLFGSFFQDGSDIFLLCDAPKPTLVSDEKKIYYETLKKFSFYESGEWGIKVNVDIPGIGQHDASKISSRFLDNSFEVKVHEFRGKNYLFSVPKASNNIDPSKCKIQIKDNSIVIYLRKEKKEEHWHQLHRQRCLIGE